MKKLVALLLAAVMAFSMTAVASADEAPAPGKIGFVTFGLGGDFFQMLADEYVKVMTEAGWEATYVDGQFDPATQISAMENYIAQEVDCIIIWAVAAGAVANVVQQARDAGIKVIAFVGELEDADAWMISDDAALADFLCKVAAKWIDEAYADAEDHSVPVAVFSCRTAETGVLQADELIKIAEFSDKAGEVREVELQSEDAADGMSAAENLYVTNPEIKVFLSAHNGLAQGINSYYTGLSSPVTEYADMGIFCINGDDAVAESIKASQENAEPLRATVMTGGVEDTAREILDEVTGIFSGKYEIGHRRMAANLVINADTVDEYLETRTVKSLTEADFDK